MQQSFVSAASEEEHVNGKVLDFVGIIVIIPGLLGLVATCRDATLSLRFGGPGGGFVGAYRASAMVVDGVIAATLLGLGCYLVRGQLQQQRPRTILIAASIIAILLGINAGRIS